MATGIQENQILRKSSKRPKHNSSKPLAILNKNDYIIAYHMLLITNNEFLKKCTIFLNYKSAVQYHKLPQRLM